MVLDFSAYVRVYGDALIERLLIGNWFLAG